jgi:hypothetical protein
MKTQNWPLLAKLLAIVAHKRLQQVHRAAFCLDGNEENLIIALFGNDKYSADNRLQSEIDGYREQLAGTGNDELGFALSPDGATWVLLTRPQLERNRTLPAKVFQLEMLKSLLDDIVSGHQTALAAFSDQHEGSRTISEYHPAK